MSGQLGQIWFIRRNSIHGAALEAAGGRNAVQRDVKGQPRLSLEEVIRLDPEAIVVLIAEDGPRPKDVVAAWDAVEPLRAVKQKKVRVLKAPEAFSNGPRILGLVERLRSTLESLAKS
jgi:iron complex transport system substrate-binding protein